MGGRPPVACPQNRDPRQGLALDTALGSAQGTQLGVGSVEPRWAQSRVPVCVSQYSGGLRQQWAPLGPQAVPEPAGAPPSAVPLNPGDPALGLGASIRHDIRQGPRFLTHQESHHGREGARPPQLDGLRPRKTPGSRPLPSLPSSADLGCAGPTRADASRPGSPGQTGGPESRHRTPCRCGQSPDGEDTGAQRTQAALAVAQLRGDRVQWNWACLAPEAGLAQGPLQLGRWLVTVKG